MRSVQITTLDGPGAVELVEAPEPETRPDRVTVEVHAAGVTFPDVLQTRGQYQLRPEVPYIPGAGVAGVVAAAPVGGPVRVGQRVAAFPGMGGFAETVVAKPDTVFPLPDTMSFVGGAALLMNHLTMLFGLVRRGRLRAGETVLVHGAAGGIGTASIQLAKALGARVIAVVSTVEKGAVATRAGADEVVDASEFLARTKELTGGAGVDIVVDPVGGDRFTDSLRSLATEGRLLVIGFVGGEIPTVRVNRLLLNNISVVGVGWGAFWTERAGYLQEQWAEIEPLLGALDPVIGATYPLESAAEALRDLDERRAVGNVVLTVR